MVLNSEWIYSIILHINNVDIFITHLFTQFVTVASTKIKGNFNLKIVFWVVESRFVKDNCFPTFWNLGNICNFFLWSLSLSYGLGLRALQARSIGWRVTNEHQQSSPNFLNSICLVPMSRSGWKTVQSLSFVLGIIPGSKNLWIW